MSVVPVIVDSRPDYFRNDGASTSLLLTPFGTETLLSSLQAGVSQVTGEPLTVLATFEPDEAYEQAVRRVSSEEVSIVPAEGFGTFLAKHEASDWLLIIDPACFPVNGFDLRELVQGRSAPRRVKHLVGLEGGADGTKEFVQLDRDRRIRRIERLYEGVTWLQASGVSGTFVSVASVRLLAEDCFVSLRDLRGELSTGGVPSHDVFLSGGVVDLNDEDELLNLIEAGVLDATSGPVPLGYTQRSDKVYVGQRCEIHPTVRLHGPVIVQEDVILEADVVVIGPALIGSGVRVGRNSVVAQCLISRGTAVPRETTVRHRVLSGDSPTEGHAASASRPMGTRVRLNAFSTMSKSGTRLVGLTASRRRSVYPAIKRAAESVIGLVGLVVLSPLLAVVAALIKIGSRGPVFYGDEREGKDGKVFRCWKFRTMVVGAHLQQRGLSEDNLMDGPQFKLAHDPRVTGIGHWLRTTNLDELPQLINVMLGQMSLIGPRPSPFRENQICVPWRQARLSVPPGITGLWQVCRHERSAGDFHQWIYYDMLYVRHLSLWLDLKVLVATLATAGGRWHVPLGWLIPDRERHGAERLSDVLTAVPPLDDRDVTDQVRLRPESAAPPGEASPLAERRVADTLVLEWVEHLRALAVRSLARMYRPDRRLFAFRICRREEGDVVEGLSRRYTASVLVGLAREPAEVCSGILAGQQPQDVCERLVDDVVGWSELGEVALTLWAARRLGTPKAAKVLEHLRGMDPAGRACPTVELSWSLTALTAEGSDVTDDTLAASIAKRLLTSFAYGADVFPHWPVRPRQSVLRPHVTSFVDQIYPIQALSYYYSLTGDAEAIDAARRCAAHICKYQGLAGQWWWHYDVRTGKVVEGYPVFAVHQDAAAPMALFALQDACGVNYGAEIERGLAWLARAPETNASLVDHEAGLIWRKVRRHEFRRWSRGAQALVSRLHPRFRVPWLDLIAPPHAVDYECRPYHMGWLLYAWPTSRVKRLSQNELYLDAGDALPREA